MQGLSTSITGRAMKNNLIQIEAVNIRDFTTEKHGHVDDYPYGGGAGMVMQAEPIYRTWKHITDGLERKPRVVYMTPQGQVFNQGLAEELAKEEDLIVLCGHYEGVDERILEMIVTDNVSIGDYVLTGGELPAMVMIDCISRLVPGVLNNEVSAEFESFHENLLEYPQYTRPEEFMGMRVPDILLSGHHANIEKWRHEQSVKSTQERRPDLYAGFKRLDKCREFLMKNKLLHIDMIELINRGCAEILFEADGEYLLRDMVSKVCFHTRPDEGGSKLIDLALEDDTKPVDKYSSQHIPENVTDQITNGIVLHQQRYVELFTANGFNETVECRQAVYTNKEKLSVSGLYRPDGRPMPNGLIIRKLDADDIQEAAPMYPGFDNPDYIIERIEAGAVYGAFFGDNTANDTINTLAGIIGIHEEGSIGMLYVKPQYRHQKLATALETYAFNRALENGWIPYGQIIVGNDASMRLQESMGLHFSKSSVYWMTKNNA